MFVLRYIPKYEMEQKHPRIVVDILETREKLVEAVGNLYKSQAFDDRSAEYPSPYAAWLECIEIFETTRISSEEMTSIRTQARSVYDEILAQCKALDAAEKERVERREYERLKAKFGAEGSSTDDHMIKLSQD